MIVKESDFVCCGECGQVKTRVSEVRGCDVCETPESEYGEFIPVTVFHDNYSEDGDSVDYLFCSWKCFLKGLSTIKFKGFIGMPYISNREGDTIASIEEFFKAIKEYDR